MKKTVAILLLLLLAFGLAACGGQPADAEESPSPLPGAAAQGGEAEDGGEEAQPEEGAKKNDLYDPSIFVIEASGSWRQELAPGYYADYECELYLDKFDANDNRSASGQYTGVFWTKTSIDAEEYISEMLQNVPVSLDFSAGGEGVCDNLTMNLLDGYERDPFGDYAIPDEQGGGAEPAKEALADTGSFITVGIQAYLEAFAAGAGGETLTYQDSRTGDVEINYVIQIAPDPTNSATERRVSIHLSTAQGMSVTLEGVWRRLPGYREDMLEYANSGKAAQVLEKHLG